MTKLENYSALHALYVRIQAAEPTFSHEPDPHPGDMYMGEATETIGKMCAVRQEIRDGKSFSHSLQIRQLHSCLEESLNHLISLEIRAKINSEDKKGKLKVRSDGKVYLEGEYSRVRHHL